MCVHYDNDNEICNMQTNLSTGGLLPPELPDNYYGCLGKKSIERPGIFTEDMSGLFSDCFDCTAATMAIGRLVRQSKGKMSYDAAKLVVAEDMYATGVADLEKLNNYDPGMTMDNCTDEEQKRRRLQDAGALDAVSRRSSDSDAEVTLTRPDKLAIEVGRAKKILSIIISPISFAALRFEYGRFLYYTKTQADMVSDPVLQPFEHKRENRTRCTDECIGAKAPHLLLFNGVCDDTGFTDAKEGPSEEKCALGTDCSDCTGTRVELA